MVHKAARNWFRPWWKHCWGPPSKGEIVLTSSIVGLWTPCWTTSPGHLYWLPLSSPAWLLQESWVGEEEPNKCHMMPGAKRDMVSTHEIPCGGHQTYLSETLRVWGVGLLSVLPEETGQKPLKFDLVYQPWSHLLGKPGETQPPQIEVTKPLLLPEEMQALVQSVMAWRIRHFVFLCNADKIAFCISQYPTLHSIETSIELSTSSHLFLTDQLGNSPVL